jgi:hypothetical protein
LLAHRKQKREFNLLVASSVSGKKDFPLVFILILKSGSKYLIQAFIFPNQKLFACYIGIRTEILLNCYPFSFLSIYLASTYGTRSSTPPSNGKNANALWQIQRKAALQSSGFVPRMV